MKAKSFFLMFILLMSTLMAEVSFARKDRGDWQAALCTAAAAQMVQYPGRELQICQGYPGCAYVAPQEYGGDCVVRDPNQRKALQGVCDYAASSMVQYPGQERRICMGYPGCAYIPPSYSTGECVPRR